MTKKAHRRVIAALTAAIAVLGFGAGYLSGTLEPVVVEPVHPKLDAANTSEPVGSTELPTANLLLGLDNFSSSMNPPEDDGQDGADKVDEAAVVADQNETLETQQ